MAVLSPPFPLSRPEAPKPRAAGTSTTVRETETGAHESNVRIKIEELIESSLSQ
jgi:hypothetical protein